MLRIIILILYSYLIVILMIKMYFKLFNSYLAYWKKFDGSLCSIAKACWNCEILISFFFKFSLDFPLNFKVSDSKLRRINFQHSYTKFANSWESKILRVKIIAKTLSESGIKNSIKYFRINNCWPQEYSIQELHNEFGLNNIQVAEENCNF